MIKIEENFGLKNLTTIKVGGPARFFVRVRKVDELKEAIEYAKKNDLEIFVMSGGSNMVVSDKGFDGLVIQINIDGFELAKEDDKDVWLKVGAGLVFDSVVKRAVMNNWWGIENLSWIPGRMGACAAQNSGAYGQQVGDVVEQLKVLEIRSGEIKIFKKDECGYGYRQSIFNTKDSGQYIVIEVVLKLAKKARPIISYPDVQKYFKERNINKPRISDIRQAIINIRTNKLPDMTMVGNAGSFFKNILISHDEFDKFLKKIEANFGLKEAGKAKELKEKYVAGAGIKILTAWLIDICGLKGAQVGYVKVYEKQPLVLITEKGKATADEVMRLFKKVRQTVYSKTGLRLEPEPKLIGFSKEELDKYFKLN